MQEINWTLVVYPIKSLKPHPKNPRQMSCEHSQHLENFIKKFGLIDKPIINKDLTIIGGHQRIKIFKKMGSKNIECWVPDVMLEQEDIDHLCIGLNLYKGDWNYDCLADNWEVLDLLKWGFSEEKLMGLYNEESKEEKSSKKKKKTCPSCGHEF